MLTKTNNCWKFKSEAELNDFLNKAIESADDYQISNYGLSNRGEYYAYGVVVIHTKFVSKKVESQAQSVEAELNLG